MNEHLYTYCNLDATLDSGQTFAFSKTSTGFTGIADGRPVEIYRRSRNYIEKIGGTWNTSATEADDGCGTWDNSAPEADNGGVCYEITYREADAIFWRLYFDLDTSYGDLIKNHLVNDEVSILQSDAKSDAKNDAKSDATANKNGAGFLTRCFAAFGGLRLLQQPVWETVCEFIISANNNVKRIESIYKRLSEHFGKTVEWGSRTYCAFPTARRLAEADESEMRAMGLGYRAPYLLDTSRIIATNGLPDLDKMEYEEALRFLMSLRGVGEKVADCILLFSTKHKNAFPVDVWIERALTEHYGMTGSRRKLKLAAQEMFGDAAGIIQQYLFHGMRTNLAATYPRPV